MPVHHACARSRYYFTHGLPVYSDLKGIQSTYHTHPSPTVRSCVMHIFVTLLILFYFYLRHAPTRRVQIKTKVDITPVDSTIMDTTLSSLSPSQFVTVKKLMTRYCRQCFLLVELHFRPYVHHSRYELSGRVKKAKGFHPTFNIMVTGPVVEL